MPRGPTVGEQDDDDGFSMDDLLEHQTSVVAGVLLVVLSVMGVAVAASAGVWIFGHEEVHAEYEDGEIFTSDLADNGTTVVVAVVDDDGRPVTQGEVSVAGGSATVSQRQTARLGQGTEAWYRHAGERTLAPNEVAFWLGDGDDEPSVELAADQAHGELTVEIHPPEPTDYADEQPNSPILVARD